MFGPRASAAYQCLVRRRSGGEIRQSRHRPCGPLPSADARRADADGWSGRPPAPGPQRGRGASIAPIPSPRRAPAVAEAMTAPRLRICSPRSRSSERAGGRLGRGSVIGYLRVAVAPRVSGVVAPSRLGAVVKCRSSRRRSSEPDLTRIRAEPAPRRRRDDARVAAHRRPGPRAVHRIDDHLVRAAVAAPPSRMRTCVDEVDSPRSR